MTAGWPLLCSIGTFTKDPEYTDYRSILHYGPQLDVDGLEVIFFSVWYPEQATVSGALRASGLRFPALHAEKSIGGLLGSARPDDRALALRRLALNCEFAQSIGAHTLILHLWGMPESDGAIERNLDALGECLTLAEGAGVTLAVETIPCRSADPLTQVRRALELDGRCRVALDTEFLAHHGQVDAALEADWLWERGSVRHVHIKDYDGRMAGPDGVRRYLHPGEGGVDFARVFADLRARGYDGCVSLESSAIARDGQVDIARLQRSLALLRSYAL